MYKLSLSYLICLQTVLSYTFNVRPNLKSLNSKTDINFYQFEIFAIKAAEKQ